MGSGTCPWKILRNYGTTRKFSRRPLNRDANLLIHVHDQYLPPHLPHLPHFPASKGEARRLIAGGGARVEGEKVEDEALVIPVAGAPVRVSAGKKKHGLLVPA